MSVFALAPPGWSSAVSHWFGFIGTPMAARFFTREKGGLGASLGAENIMVKAIGLGVILTGAIALVIGSQGTSAGPLAVEPLMLNGYRFYWSWPIFAAGSGLSWGIMLLQR
ncbi:MAG: hypothetical protein AAF692_03330 [Pseudomonadota bacterium]